MFIVLLVLFKVLFCEIYDFVRVVMCVNIGFEFGKNKEWLEEMDFMGVWFFFLFIEKNFFFFLEF